MNGSICIAQQPAGAMVSPSWQRRAARMLVNTVERLWLWHERARSRRMLLGMDDRMLQDIGTDRASAQLEGTRPFWK